MTDKQFILESKRAVLTWELTDIPSADEINVTIDDVFTVWYCKTLQNWKGLFATSKKDGGMYFEVTYNGDKEEYYLDVYAKLDNKVLKPTIGITND